MSILTGADGSVKINDVEIIKCRSWSGTLARRVVEQTTRGFMDKGFLMGKRTFQGIIRGLIVDNNIAVVSLADCFNQNNPTVLQIELLFSEKLNTGFSFDGYIEALGSEAKVNAATEETYTVVSTGPITKL
jgi:hypothetical protein